MKQFKKINRKIPLKWSMTGMLVLGWLLPLLLIAFCLIWFISGAIGGQIEKTVRISTDKAVEICEMQMSELIKASKNASYNSTVRDSYLRYKEDGKEEEFRKAVSDKFLRQYYKYDSNLPCTFLFLIENPDKLYFTYNTYRDNNETAYYERVDFFREKVLGEALELSPELDTRTTLLMKEERLYLVRNIVDSRFRPYAMIVMELKPEYVFESLNGIWGAEEFEVFVDGVPLFGNGCGEGLSLEELRAGGRFQSSYSSDARGDFSYRVVTDGSQEMIYLVKLNSRMLLDDAMMLRWVLVLVLVFMAPLIIIIFRFFHTRINRPVAGLIAASREIADGKFGVQVTATEKSQEFDYLENAFNAMSVELKYQFEQIYLEELALRDANIMALQSQINPHFLNNTLEIINWEARMNGNDKVSRMIEALATMLNATMNRKQKRFVPLSEELEYVDAYLYIIRQRFGERFRSGREVDEKLLDRKVPLLIIQPIVENAVEHGMSGRRDGEVSLKIYAEEDKMYIEVINEGKLSEADRDRIAYLLGDEVQDENEHHVSLGIRNVDRRLKIIYGEDCGLSIRNDNENHTVSTLTVKINKDNNNSQ